MARNSEDLVLSSRYIHTGNSGVTFSVNRDVRRPNKAILFVTNGAFGAFHTEMIVRGNDHEGMSSRQLRDLALMFLDAAAYLDAGEIPFSHRESPNIIPSDDYAARLNNLPSSIEDLLPGKGYFPTTGIRFARKLLQEFPDIAALFDLISKEKSSKKASWEQETSSSDAEAPKQTSKQLDENRKRLVQNSTLLTSGLDLVRAYWMHKLASDNLKTTSKLFADLVATFKIKVVGDSWTRLLTAEKGTKTLLEEDDI